MRKMRKLRRRCVAAVVLVVTAMTPLWFSLQPASAFPAGDPVIPFDYTVNATTHLKTLDQTITVPAGRFVGGIDVANTPDRLAPLAGNITLPPATFTYKAAGILGLVTATAKISQTQPVTGTLDLNTFVITATATFNIRIVNAHATGSTTNLVGNSCVTATPVSVTMSGPASLGGASTFTGEYTLPKFKTCGLGTTALNLVLPGPGNTFTAVATPRS
jgi:hypothetical protein